VAVEIEVEDVVMLARAVMLTMALACLLTAGPAYSAVRVLVISGLGGESAYEQKFQKQASAVAEAAARTGAAQDGVVVLSGEQARRSALDGELKKFAGGVQKDDQVAVVLIGHGSYDGEDYRFNLPGPDITGREIVTFLDSLPASQMLVVNATSSSGAVLESWKRPNRVVITATKSGTERNATRFAEYWVQALTTSEADRDKNEIVTAAEAYDYASRRVADTFKSDASLATEHSRIDGKIADRLVVARLGNAALLPADATLDAMMKEQQAIEQQIDALKARKESLDREQYYNELETVLLSLARLDKRIDERKAVLTGAGSTNSVTGAANAPQNRQ
jgi:hypothetical protein